MENENKDINIFEDGTLISQMRNRFISEPSAENLSALLFCLKDASVFVSMTVELSKSDADKICEDAGEGDVECSSAVRMKPDIMKDAEGKMYFPVFTEKRMMPEDYTNGYTSVRLPFVECLDMAHEVGNLEGLVMDPFSLPVVLPFELADVVHKFENLSKDKEK